MTAVLLAAAFVSLLAAGEKFPPPTQAALADDREDLAGKVLLLTWAAPSQAPPAGWRLAGYRVRLSRVGKPEQTVALITDASKTEFRLEGLHPRYSYTASVEAIYVPEGRKLIPDPDQPLSPAPGIPCQFSPPATAGPQRPIGALFNPKRLNVLIAVLLYGALVLILIRTARQRDFYIRPIAGLQAVDDAIGRATEMGRPLLYVSGLAGLGSISTIASMLILAHLARRTAAYETPILVPCNDPLVMTAEREIVREAYLEAGRPDAFRPENIFFITDSQFGYVAAVDGIIMRERPAANFYMGYFFAESLILAETGNMAGCIQIAGTDADTQLPFFITACDYTLMGEELYAAGAYLSRHPVLVAQLKGQDLGKAALAIFLMAGVILATLAELGLLQPLYEHFMNFLATG